MAGIRAAASREQLNDLYVNHGTLIILEGGSDESKVKVACRVSQIGGASAPLKVHSAADPGKKAVQDTVVSANDSARDVTSNTQPPLDPHKHRFFTRVACGRVPTTHMNESSLSPCSADISPIQY